jgi:hypothetical protein
MEDIIKEFLKNSRCTSKIEEKLFLLKLLGNNRIVTKPLYCGIFHGMTPSAFHGRSNGKNPTITLLKVKDTGECIGGYTNA